MFRRFLALCVSAAGLARCVASLLLALTVTTGCGGDDADADAPPRAPIVVNEDGFQAAVLDRPQLPVLVVFWAKWNAPCRAMEAPMADLALAYAGRAVVVRMDFDEETKLAAEYKVRSLPAYLIFKDGALVDTLSGVVKRDKIEAALAPHLPPPEDGQVPKDDPAAPTPAGEPTPTPTPAAGSAHRGG